MENRLQKIYVTYYNHWWCQIYVKLNILLIIFLKEFIELNVTSDTTIKKIETYGIKYKYRCCLKYKYRYCLLLIHTNFPTNTTIRLFHCCKKVFIFMNIWTIRKKINETSLPKKEDFYSHLNMKGITDADSARKKSL